jgi:hypothetical protein
MTISDGEITSDLDSAINRYEAALSAINKASNPQPEKVLEVLAARDVLSATLDRKFNDCTSVRRSLERTG